MKKDKARTTRGTNSTALIDERTQLDLIEEVAMAARDLANILAGSKVPQEDLVDKIQACDKAGVLLSAHARCECIAAKSDILLRCFKYNEVTALFGSRSPEAAELTDAGMDTDALTLFAVEQVERIAMIMINAIPEDLSSKPAAKAKDEAIKYFQALIEASGEESDFLGKAFKPQAQDISALLSWVVRCELRVQTEWRVRGLLNSLRRSSRNFSLSSHAPSCLVSFGVGQVWRRIKMLCHCSEAVCQTLSFEHSHCSTTTFGCLGCSPCPLHLCKTKRRLQLPGAGVCSR